jgi:undecaprenyl-diphosphatase
VAAGGGKHSDGRWLSIGWACAVALLGAVCLAGLASFAGTSGGRAVDEALLKFLDQQGGDATLLQLADGVNGSIVPIAVVWCGALVVVARRRRGVWTDAVAVVGLVVSAVVASEVLKTLIAVHHGALGASVPASLDHTWPSAHAATAAGLAMASLCMFPSPLGAVIGVAAATIISICLLLAAAHFPSDVLAGWLVAASASAFVSLAVWLQRHRWPSAPLV